MIIFDAIDGFDWDDGNYNKNWKKHAVTPEASEEVFFNKPLIIAEDKKHSRVERRYAAYGKTNKGVLLTVIFTLRETKIRIISARSMSKKEKFIYEQ